jgi:hypothetical protein
MKWRTTFSHQWYIQFCSTTPTALPATFRLLLQLTEESHESICVGAFNAIGGLLVVLSPFHAESLIAAVSQVLNGLPQTPNIAISILSIFVFLSHQVAPFRVDDFLRQFLVTHFFSANIKPYYDFLPQLIRNMKSLPFEIHRALMTNLRRFGRDPTPNLIESLVCLLERFPQELTRNFLNFASTNHFDSLLLAMGSQLLNSPQLFAQLSPADVESLFTLAKASFDDIQNATSVEQNVCLLKSFLKRQADLPFDIVGFAEGLVNREWPFHIRRHLFSLVANLEALNFSEEDSISVTISKIAALDSLVMQAPDKVIDIIMQLLGKANEVSTSVLEFLTRSFGILFAQSSKEKVRRLFKAVIQSEWPLWVQLTALVNFIAAHAALITDDLLENSVEICVPILVSAALSAQQSLAEAARKAAVAFIGLDGVDILVRLLLACDFFDFQMTKVRNSCFSYTVCKKCLRPPETFEAFEFPGVVATLTNFRELHHSCDSPESEWHRTQESNASPSHDRAQTMTHAPSALPSDSVGG